MQEQIMDPTIMEPVQQDYIFALDIGTRSVIGIVGRLQDGLFQVLDTEYAEHDKRAMYDGQIEDIDQVARISGLVKERLEERLDVSFGNVCVAAAGRALCTSRSSFELEMDPEEALSAQGVYQLEMGAIGVAQDEVNASREEEQGLFCVGYSVTGYYLDGYRMTTILGHKGRKARVELIATFLPNQVVDSLRSAMLLIGLNIINLTLEPIAAMNAVIPAELRLLNLALVDIGAGTSDIAVSDQGSVTAYTMATTAGDEITEYLMKRYLIDFSTSEKLKSAAGSGDELVEYTDILGFAYKLEREELLETLRTPVQALCDEICKRVLESNGGNAPVAMFLVGGGSKVPLLAELVAQRLGIDPSKVAVGGSAYMKKQTTGKLDVSDPEYATPLGIAITAANFAEQNSMYVFVNDNRVQMLRSAGFTVMNALLICGYKYPQLMGKSGNSVTFTVNEERIMVRGGLPKPAEITVNDKPASIATGLVSGDRIIIMPSVSGVDAQPRVGDYTQTHQEQQVTLDGIPCLIGELAFVNEKPARREQLLENDDNLTTLRVDTLGELCTQIGILTQDRHFIRDGRLMELLDRLENGDVILSEDDAYEFRPVVGRAAQAEAVWVNISEPGAVSPVEWAEPEMPEAAPPVQVQEARMEPTGPCMTVTLNQRTLELFPKEDRMPYIFLDMLNYVDIDPSKPEGDIVLRVNGANASYMQELHQGDAIQIYWSQRADPLLR